MTLGEKKKETKMSDKPEGEWTARPQDDSWTSRWFIDTRVMRIWFNNSETAKAVADAHNAALAEAKRHHAMIRLALDEETAAHAAEREAWDKQFTATMTVLGETQKQLAAERMKPS